MSTRTSVVVALLGALLPASSAFAGPGVTNDHLVCFGIKDPAAKVSYTTMVSDEGGAPVTCVVKVPAKQICVGAAKMNVAPPPPSPGVIGASLDFFLCYRAKCPVPANPGVSLGDQFGSRLGVLKKTKTLCTPASATP